MTIIVCGSAMSVMTGILSGTSPMRGRGPRRPTIGVVRPSAKQAGSRVSANPDLARLDRITHLLAEHKRTAPASTIKRLLSSLEGFTPDLTTAAHRRSDVELVDLERLYEGE